MNQLRSVVSRALHNGNLENLASHSSFLANHCVSMHTSQPYWVSFALLSYVNLLKFESPLI